MTPASLARPTPWSFLPILSLASLVLLEKFDYQRMTSSRATSVSSLPSCSIAYVIYKTCNSYLTPPVGLWNGDVVEAGPTDLGSSVSLRCQIREVSVQVQVLSRLPSNDPSIVTSSLICKTNAKLRTTSWVKISLSRDCLKCHFSQRKVLDEVNWKCLSCSKTTLD